MGKTEQTKLIENAIYEFRGKNDILINEFNLKCTKYNLIYDYISLDLVTNLIIGYEVKVSKADFANLQRKIDSIESYDLFVDKFYVCIPVEMEDYVKNKLDDWDMAYVGIKTFDSTNGLFKTKRAAKYSKNDFHYQEYIKDNMIEKITKKYLQNSIKKG